MKEQLQAVIAWFSVPGRKRTIAVVSGLLSGALRGIEQPLRDLCATAVFALDSAWCKANPDAWAYWIGNVNEAIQTVLVPGADLAFIAFGIVGLIHAKTRKEATVQLRPKQ